MGPQTVWLVEYRRKPPRRLKWGPWTEINDVFFRHSDAIETAQSFSAPSIGWIRQTRVVAFDRRVKRCTSA
jgi:hypothetical protein